jgi:hypothetical protein
MANHSGNLLIGSSAHSHWTAKSLLERFALEFASCCDLELEFSLRLGRGTLQNTGRFACWVNGSRADDFARVRQILNCIGAPVSVLEAQQDDRNPVRQAIAVAIDHSGIEFRLYLHGRTPGTLDESYRAWRWRTGEVAQRSKYSFHFMPETASGMRPIELVPDDLRLGFQRLLQHPRLAQMSGFWLRYGEHEKIEQLDLALPWHPLAGTLEGLQDLLGALNLPEAALDSWRELPVRHIAVSVNANSPAVTLYASAPISGPFPANEDELQNRVFENSSKLHSAIREQILQRVEPLACQEDNADLGAFYDGPIEAWQTILGPSMHYHAGFFESAEMNPGDEAMTQALRRAVTELYPFLPAGGRIYDIGCGWGGPLEMFISDLGCPSLGLTISRKQFQHVAARGLPVRWGNAETTLPPGEFDAIVLLESLSHIRNKERLLKILRFFSKRLVMRVNCQDSFPPGPAFGDSMHMISSTRLREMLQHAGWKIVHWRDRRPEAVVSVAVWHRRFQSLPPTRDRHLETFRDWCARVVSFPDEWATHNPLIEVVAERC